MKGCIMKIFTIEKNKIKFGAVVDKNPKYKNPVILVGEKKQFCKQVFLPVSGAAVGSKIYTGEIIKTKTGRKKLAAGRHFSKNKCLLILRTDLNDLYSNLHYGEYEGDSFPGIILERGVVSVTEGESFGDQLIVVMPENEVFTISGSETNSYFFDGEKIIKKEKITKKVVEYLEEGKENFGEGITSLFK